MSHADIRVKPAPGLENFEVAGLTEDGFVLAYSKDFDHLYNTGLSRDDFVHGTNSWLLTRAEAERIGVKDYSAYRRGHLTNIVNAIADDVVNLQAAMTPNSPGGL